MIHSDAPGVGKLFVPVEERLIFDNVEQGDFVLVQWKEDPDKYFAWWKGVCKKVTLRAIEVTFPNFKNMPEYEKVTIEPHKHQAYKNKSGVGYLGGMVVAPQAVLRQMNVLENMAAPAPPKKGQEKLPPLGSQIELYWPDENDWFVADVLEYDARDGCTSLRYADGQAEWVDLTKSKWRLVSPAPERYSRSASPQPKTRRTKKAKTSAQQQGLPGNVARECTMRLITTGKKKPKPSRWEATIRYKTKPDPAEIKQLKRLGSKKVKYNNRKHQVTLEFPIKSFPAELPLLSFLQPLDTPAPPPKSKRSSASSRARAASSHKYEVEEEDEEDEASEASEEPPQQRRKKPRNKRQKERDTSSARHRSSKKRQRPATQSDDESSAPAEEPISIQDTKHVPQQHGIVGRGVSIYWEDSNAWYAGKIQGFDEPSGKTEVIYYDGVVEWLDLKHETAVFVENVPHILSLPTGPSHDELRDAIRKHRAEARRSAKIKRQRFDSEDHESGSESSTIED